MRGITGFKKRVAWVAVVAVLGVVSGAEAQYPYVVKNILSIPGRVVVSQNGEICLEGAFGLGVGIDSAMSFIRKEANARAVVIDFDTTNGGVDIGSGVNIVQKPGVVPRWGSVTVTGSVVSSRTGSSGGALTLSSDSGVFNVKVRGKISVVDGADGNAIMIDNFVSIRLDTCTITTGAGNVLHSRTSASAPPVIEINGGKFKSTGGSCVYMDIGEGVTKINGGEFGAGGSYAVYTKGELNITGGKFVSTGFAVYSRGVTKINGGEFEAGGNHAVYSTGELNITGGKYVSAKSAVYSNSIFSIVRGEFEAGSGYVLRVSGKGKIDAGSFKAKGTTKALQVDGGDVLIAGGAAFVSASDSAATIQLAGGSVRFANVDIKNQYADGHAVSMTGAATKLVLGGPVLPKIKGKIETRYVGAISVDSTFYPNDDYEYQMEPTGGACYDGAVAVVGGAAHKKHFKYNGSRFYEFNTKGDDIIVSLKNGSDTPSYVVTGDSATGFVASIKKGSSMDEIGRGVRVSAVLDSIRINANGRPCSIKFGSDSSVLNIGTGTTQGIQITSATNGVEWGLITLTGKMASTRSGGRGNSYALYVNDGMFVESRMDNPSASGHAGSVYVGAGSRFTHRSGNLCCQIYNLGGDVTVDGGIVGSDALDAPAINNSNQSGSVTISGDAEIVSANTTVSRGTVENNGGILEINGGIITAKNGYAVVTSGVKGALISQYAEITTASPNGAVYIGSNGYLYLYGGKVSSTSVNSTAKAIVAYEGSASAGAGRLVMSGSPEVKGIISLPGGQDSPAEILVDPGYVFNPVKKSYSIAMPVSEGDVVVKNGAGFSNNFNLDTTGGIRLMTAVNANDVVATGSTCDVSFRTNGAMGQTFPASIKVKRGGTIGILAKPPTDGYVFSVGTTGYPNDGEWYECKQPLAGGKDVMELMPFQFSDYGFHNGDPISVSTMLTLYWGDVSLISVLNSPRDLPLARPAESAAIAPVSAAASGSLTAGPTPVSSASGGTVNFFRSGVALKGGKLFIYDASGNMVTKVIVNDSRGGTGRRPVAKWNLQDAAGRKVADGTYVARGIVATKAGKSERVSILISVR